MSNIESIIKQEISLEDLKLKIINGYDITKEEALKLVDVS